MNDPILSPSVMCIPQWQDASGIIDKMQQLGVQVLHADIMDGEFVPNLMLGTESVKALRKISSLPLDIHMMIQRPDEKLEWFDLQPGEFVSIHVESVTHLQRALTKIRSFGARPIVALNPSTPLCVVEDVLDDVDGILLMTVNPGYAGQQLVPQTIDKIARLRKLLDETGHSHVRIEVDGNVSFENAKKMRSAGADMFVCGSSSIFAKSGSLEDNTSLLWKCVGTERSAAR